MSLRLLNPIRFPLFFALWVLMFGPVNSLAATPDLPENFQKQAGGKLVLLDFYSAYCGTCQKMEPKIKALAAKARENLQYEHIDVASASGERYASLYDVHLTPTYILFSSLGKPVYRSQKIISADLLARQVFRLTGKLQPVTFPPEITLPAPAAAATGDISPERLQNLILLSLESNACPDCKTMVPYLQGFELSGQKGLSVLHVDTDTPGGRELMGNLAVKTLPAYILLDNADLGQPRQRGELFRTGGPIQPRTLWDVIRLFADAGV